MKKSWGKKKERKKREAQMGGTSTAEGNRGRGPALSLQEAERSIPDLARRDFFRKRTKEKFRNWGKKEAEAK